MSPARRGWTIVMQVKQVGSGAFQRQRREKLLEAAHRRQIDPAYAGLVWRLDRWGRSLADLVATLHERTSGSRIRIADGGAGPDDAQREPGGNVSS